MRVKRCLSTAFIVALLFFLAGCHMPTHITIGCSVTELVDAIHTANSSVNDTNIELAPGCTYSLTGVDNEAGFGSLSPGESQGNGLPAITTKVYILGNIDDPPTIERSSALGTPEFRFFFVSQNGMLSLKHLTLRNGVNAWAGGAIAIDQGTLKLTGVTLADNSSPGNAPYANTVGGGSGGAIYNEEGSVVIQDSSISGNNAQASGGAIGNSWGGELVLSGLTIIENNSAQDGGAISNLGTLTMSGGRLTNNTGSHSGGAILNRGTATFSNVGFLGNTAPTGEGGAINNLGADFPGILTLSGCSFSVNRAALGGAIHSLGGTVTITLSQFESNSTNGQLDGGAIYNSSYGSTIGLMSISGSTIEINIAQEAGGGIFNAGNMSIQDSTISSNHAVDTGGGIFNGMTPSGSIGQLFMFGSTVMNNQAFQGAAMTSTTEVMIVNSTITGNQGEYNGGFQNNGTSTILSSTIAYNSGVHGAGIYANDGSILIRNSIVAHNQYSNCAVNEGIIQPDGENISDDASCGGFSLTANPLISPLANNGGLTQTHALRIHSPAIDAVGAGDCLDAIGDQLAVDQRGVGRPLGSLCDIGAFEYIPLAPPPSITTPLSDLTSVQIEMNVNCRAGSSTSFTALTILPQGISVPLVGVNPSHSWYLVRPPALEIDCWVWEGAITAPDDLRNIPVLVDPATPTPIFPAEVPEEPAGLPQGCWVSSLSVGGGGHCAYPCPAHAWPGGPCTP